MAPDTTHEPQTAPADQVENTQHAQQNGGQERVHVHKVELDPCEVSRPGPQIFTAVLAHVGDPVSRPLGRDDGIVTEDARDVLRPQAEPGGWETEVKDDLLVLSNS